MSFADKGLIFRGFSFWEAENAARPGILDCLLAVIGYTWRMRGYRVADWLLREPAPSVFGGLEVFFTGRNIELMDRETISQNDLDRIEMLDPEMVELLRSKTPAEKVAMTLSCNRTMRRLLAGHLRTRHADWDDQQIASEIARRMLGGTR